MENFDLRRRVAEALGCSPVYDTDYDELICPCEDYKHGCQSDQYPEFLPDYPSNVGRTMEALIEFCEKIDWFTWWRVERSFRKEYEVLICWKNLKYYAGRHKSLALAICEAIVVTTEALKIDGVIK